MRGERIELAGSLGEAKRIIWRQRRRFDDVPQRCVRAYEPALGVTAGDAEQPWVTLQVFDEMAEETGRRIVHVMRVLDLDQGWFVQDYFQESGYGLVQPRPDVTPLPASRPRGLRAPPRASASRTNGNHGSSSGSRADMIPYTRSSTASSDSSHPRSRSSRSSSRHTEYGVDGRVRLARGSQQEQTFGTIADLLQQS